MKLITGERFENVKTNLVNEFNDLTYQLNRKIYLLSSEEIIAKHSRIIELNMLLGIGKNIQLDLFSL